MGFSQAAIAYTEAVGPTDFVDYLASRNLVTPAQAEALRKSAETSQIPIGQILVRGGDLGVKQVMKILSIQAESPQLRFGEIAVQLGFIGVEQLDGALHRQAQTRKHQLEVVAAANVLPADDAMAIIAGYVASLEARLER